MITENSNVALRAMEQRGSKRPVFLECIQKDGRCTAFAYSYLTEIRFNPNLPELRCFFGETEILARGRNLAQVYEGLRMCRLTQIEEKDLAEDTGSEDTVFVDSLLITSVHK